MGELEIIRESDADTLTRDREVTTHLRANSEKKQRQY